jgi:hypothetical protein
LSLSAATLAELPRVEATLNYLMPTSGKPRCYACGVAQDEPESPARYERRRVKVHDARSVADFLSLDDEGLQLVRQKSAVHDFLNDEQVTGLYYREAERLVAAATGACWVLAFDHTVRQRIYGTPDRTPGAPRQPVLSVQNDYTEQSAPQRVRELTGHAAGALLRRRFAVINVWRPIRGPLYDAPIAVCDANTMPVEDLIATDLIYRDRIGETYAVRYNPAHRWLYISGMLPDEALLLKCYDSRRDGVARFAPYSAFEDPSAPADRLVQESIELRTLAFFAD